MKKDYKRVFKEKNNSSKRNAINKNKIVNQEDLQNTRIVGVFQKSRNFGFVVPDGKKVTNDIYIPKKECKKVKNRQKVVVEITKPSIYGKKAEGRIVEVIGNIDEAGVDLLSLVKEYDLPYEFPEQVLQEAKAIKPEIAKKDIPKRLDLRDKEIFTIDGEDAKDLDDAVAVEKLKNGNYLLNVSIADVSYYVKEGSKIDKEAILRGTSIYMLDRVIPMLPKELSNGICSLNQKEDRFAITVLMEIDKNGNVVSSDVQKSIINVTRRMSYKEVQAILNEIQSSSEEKQKIDKEEKKSQEKGKKDKIEKEQLEEQDVEELYTKKENNKKENNEKENTEAEELYSKDKRDKLLKECYKYIAHFERMAELAKILKNKRNQAGSLNLDIPESKIILDENGVAIDVKKYELYFSNEIIEQFMLTANETVAEKYNWLELPFIYRVHEVPDIDKVKELNQFLWNLGYKIKITQDTVHPTAFAEVINAVKGKPEERVVSNLILRTLKIARYESENKGHFGIASKYYCHFTSPIRRYPDLFIHRMISMFLETNYQIKESQLEKYYKQATRYAESSSECERIAQKVERDADDMKKAEYMQSKIGEEYDGIISSVTSFGIFVELENTVEGLIRFEDLGDEYFFYDEQNKILRGERTNKVYKIGDRIKIKVKYADKLSRKIDFRICEKKDKKKIEYKYEEI